MEKKCNNCGDTRWWKNYGGTIACEKCYNAKCQEWDNFKASGGHMMPLSMHGPFVSVSHSGNDIEYVSRRTAEALKAKERLQRLSANKRTLYHQTSLSVANSIVSSQLMMRGNEGLAASGIYFAKTAADTDRKAHEKGVILQATVLLGGLLVV